MRVLMLANPDAVHTVKWVHGLAARGVDVHLLGVQRPMLHTYHEPRVTLSDAGVPVWITQKGEGSFTKAFYLKAVSKVRELVRTWQPDLIHAHYASSYGLIGALASRHPFLISVWGSDVYEYPDRAWLNQHMLKWSFKRADRISSTSHVMAQRTQQFTSQKIDVIPFGIDVQNFAPRAVARPFATTDIVIGTVKTLSEKYGIRYLIEAFALLKQRHPLLPLKLLIVGGGPQEQELKDLVNARNLNAHTHFAGFVPLERVPIYHNMLDIYVALSTVDSESFGVAIIEASACGKPVVVSDAGGLPEVVKPGETGLIVRRCRAEEAADAIEKLVLNPRLAKQMGQAGLKHVRETYNLETNLDQMLELYRAMVNRPIQR
jgi:glycosyltransferase involved in cell wall biosynthesis